MIKSASYAEVLPKLRALKARLLTPEKARELFSTSSLDDAITVLRDTIYGVVGESRSVEGVIIGLVNLFFQTARSIEGHAPSEAKPLVQAFVKDEELKDALTALQRAYAGRPGVYELPTYRVEGSLLSVIARDPEAIASPHRFVESSSATWARRYISRAAELFGEVKEPYIVSWYHLPASIDLYMTPLDKLGSLSRRGVEKVLCPMIEYRISAALIQAKAGGIDSRILDRFMEGVKGCGLSWRNLKPVYDREQSPMDLAIALRGVLKRVRLEGNSYLEALESARRSYRVEAKASATLAYAGYPYTPALIAAALMLLKIDVEDIAAALTAIALNLKPDEYMALTVLER